MADTDANSRLVVVDTGIGNFGSILNMLKRIDVPAIRSADPRVIAEADRLVLPGVGAFDRVVSTLDENGLRGVLNRRVMRDRVPILGICVGMQAFGAGSEEGERPGLAWLPFRCVRFRFEKGENAAKFRIPHMGWNYLEGPIDHPLLAGLDGNSRFYFVHSYHPQADDPAIVYARTAYGGAPFPSIVGRANVAGVQFHPEKSHRFGMQILRNFARWQPAP